MTTHTAEIGRHFDMPRATRALAQRFMPLDRQAAAARPDWLTRLATWAERQPNHHRLGSCWTLQR